MPFYRECAERDSASDPVAPSERSERMVRTGRRLESVRGLRKTRKVGAFLFRIELHDLQRALAWPGGGALMVKRTQCVEPRRRSDADVLVPQLGKLDDELLHKAPALL
jgi:hypothetical protein